MKLALRLETLGMPFRAAVEQAARLGFTGVQFSAVGELSPTQLSQSAVREIKHLLRTHNLACSALDCPLRRGLDDEIDLQPRLEWLERVLNFAFELGSRLVLVDLVALPDDLQDPRLGSLFESLLTLSKHGDLCGSRLGLRTGLSKPEVLRTLLQKFDTGSLVVNYNPANLLVHGFDPYQAIRTLKEFIAHAEAQDARKASASRLAQHVALGAGDLDWLQLCAHFAEIEYKNYLTLGQEARVMSSAEVTAGSEFLRRLLPG